MKEMTSRLLILFLVLGCCVASLPAADDTAKAKPAPPASADAQPGTAAAVNVEMTAASAAPREVEDVTAKAVVRDYAAAWTTLERALGENRADILGASFVGVAQEKLAEKVKQQQHSGLRIRYVDRGHKLEATFYSPEGSAMQLRDMAQLEVQLLDGDKVVGSQNLTLDYIVLLTVGEDGWKVRVLDAVPGS
jgi:hypothetical protein